MSQIVFSDETFQMLETVNDKINSEFLEFFEEPG
jgi:hypothetical protein